MLPIVIGATFLYLVIGLATYLKIPKGARIPFLMVLLGWPIIAGIIVYWALTYRK